MLTSIKSALKALMPQSVIDARRAKALVTLERDYAGKTNTQIFSEIYENHEWGGAGDDHFYSGTGSHDDAIVKPYVDAVIAFIKSLPAQPDAVDLGCGDFNVGRQVRPFCGSYVGCDVVPALIARNIATFDGDFRSVDIANDDIPNGEVVFIRQVLQHLSNADIARVVPKLTEFKYIVVTEHLPAGDFVANKDKPAGKGIRLGIASGVVLTEPPFLLAGFQQKAICEVGESNGIIRTMLYAR